ncbi:MAG: hypothetical protein H0U22_04310, partial [Geodermatophilaceae bacterium]|nr:hypothetical protein [Geodermatophilaceae bacterium]
MFEAARYAEWAAQGYPPEVDVDALQARHPWASQYFQDDPAWIPDPAWLAELEAMPSPPPDRVYLDEDRPLYDRDPDTFTDAKAITRLIEVEAGIAAAHALRARLVALIAAQRPATGDRPEGRPGAAGWET